MKLKPPVTAIALALALAWTAGAQIPATTRYAVSHVGGILGSNMLIGLDRGGVITTMVTLPSIVPPNAVTMAPANDAVLVFDAGGVHRIDLATGKPAYSTLTTGGGNIHFGMVDEDGGIAWVIGSGATRGRFYWAARPDGTHTRLVKDLGLIPFDVITRLGSTGHYAVADTRSTSSNILVLARDGSVKTSIAVPATISGLDWNVWEDKLYATARGNGGKQALLAIDVQTKTVTAVGPTGSIVSDLQGVETFEQPSNRLIVAEAGADPQHMFTFDPGTAAVTTIHLSSGKIRFADVAILGARTFWALNLVEVGSKTPLSVNFGAARAGEAYQVALSFGFKPGINVAGAGRIHLNLDGLMLASVLGGPPIFQNFQGLLDASGVPKTQPAFTIPFIPALQGIRIYGSALAIGSGGIRAISNSWGITILGPPE